MKALGLHWRGNRLVACEGLDDAGAVKGVRPLGETAEAAVIREFREELGITVTTIGAPVFMENILTHEGSLGHEILALFDVVFPPDAFAAETRVAFKEASGATCLAEWFALDDLDLPGRPRL